MVDILMVLEQSFDMNLIIILMFLKNLEAELLEVQSDMLRFAGMGTLQKMIYSKEPALKDLPTSGVFNLPLMWSFTQGMTIHHFSHLIELKDERKNVPLLSELLKSVGLFITVIIICSHIISTTLNVEKVADHYIDDLSV